MCIFMLPCFQIHFGESSMQRCEIMLNDLIDSKRTNSNIKATTTQPFQTGVFKIWIYIFWVQPCHSLQNVFFPCISEVFCISICNVMSVDSEQGEAGVSLDILDATILSSNFWPPIQVPNLFH